MPESTITVTGLNVLSVYVTDIAKSESFYCDHLGFQKYEDLPPGILLKGGDITLYLEARRTGIRKKDTNKPGFSPCFQTESVRSTYTKLKAAGIPINKEYEEFGPEFSIFRILDPDGNLIEFAGKP